MLAVAVLFGSVDIANSNYSLINIRMRLSSGLPLKYILKGIYHISSWLIKQSPWSGILLFRDFS